MLLGARFAAISLGTARADRSRCASSRKKARRDVTVRPDIPARRLRMAHNLTPFAMFACQKMGVGRKHFDTVVFKATYTLAPGRLELAETQTPVALADEYWDLAAPERSSMKYAGDAVLFKPSTDVIVTGSARSPHGEPRASWYAAVAIKNAAGTVLEHAARVTGPRQWRHSRVRGWSLSPPEPATEVPIRYERAYGGAYLDRSNAEPTWIVHEPNPSGTGFFDDRALDRESAYPAPQWELPHDPAERIDREIALAGFGPIMRPWSARYRYAGTYDDGWLETMRSDLESGLPPDYPPDFDERFFQCAHPALITPEYLGGSETFELLGVSHEHARFTFELPGVNLCVRMRTRSGQWGEDRLPLDTVHVDLERERVYLCWRLTLEHEADVEHAFVGISEDE
jgi:hypothetical protein